MSIVACVAAHAVGPARAGDWRDPVPSVPTALHGHDQAELGKECLALRDQLSEIDKAVAAHNADCGKVADSDTEKTNECRKRQEALLARIEQFKKRKQTFRVDLEAALNRAIAETEECMVATRKRLGETSQEMQDYSKAMEEWGTISDDAREAAHTSAIHALTTTLAAGLATTVDASIARHEDALTRVDGLMKRKILPQALLAKAPELRTAIEAHLTSLKTGADVVRLFEVLAKAPEAVSLAEEDDREAFRRELLVAIEVLSPNPAIHVLVASGDVWVDAAYGWFTPYVAKARVDQLCALENSQLVAIQSLSQLYKEDVRHLTELKTAKKQLSSNDK
ncbi:MAG: hypothetical protein HY292_11725 [Planctomycetes bacterium]|nr:hypothetical protein [Planctomycetota bacterium]